MSERETANSTNPVNKPFPEIFTKLKGNDQIALKMIWNSSEMPLSGKLDFIEKCMVFETEEIQKEYRKWLFEFNRENARQRFETDRNTKPSFMESQNAQLQEIFEMILEKKPSLEKFYSYALTLRKSLDNYGEFLQWARSEYLDLPDEDEVAFNEVNKSIEKMQVSKARQCNQTIKYFTKLENKFNRQIDAIFSDEILHENSIYFYHESTKSICSSNINTFPVDQIGKFSFSPNYSCNITYLDNKYYAINHNTKKVEVFDVYTEEISILESNPPNVQDRGVLGHYKEKLCYFPGGKDSQFYIYSNGVWTEGPKMNLGISISCGVCIECNGRFFVIDTYCGSNKIAEYCEAEKQWKHVGNIDMERDYSSVICLNDKIYVTGGKDYKNGNKYLKSSIVLTPTSNGLTCTKIADMNYARSYHSLVAANGKIYAVGGSDGNGDVRFIEEYDPKLDKWTVLGQMKHSMAISS